MHTVKVVVRDSREYIGLQNATENLRATALNSDIYVVVRIYYIAIIAVISLIIFIKDITHGR